MDENNILDEMLDSTTNEEHVHDHSHDHEPVGVTEPIYGYVPDNNPDDGVVDTVQLARDVVFVGDFDDITASIIHQFENYISTEDRTNYIDIFIEDLNESYRRLNDGEIDIDYDDATEALDIMFQEFIGIVRSLISRRLALGINDNGENLYSDAEIVEILNRVYEYFILRAPHNFKVAIANDVERTIGPRPKTTEPDVSYFNRVIMAMGNYSPLITSITPEDFLKFTADPETIRLFEECVVVGNFMEKYTPKLYENELFTIELINYITSKALFEEDLENLSQPVEEPTSDSDPETLKKQVLGKIYDSIIEKYTLDLRNDE